MHVKLFNSPVSVLRSAESHTCGWLLNIAAAHNTHFSNLCRDLWPIYGSLIICVNEHTRLKHSIYALIHLEDCIQYEEEDFKGGSCQGWQCRSHECWSCWRIKCWVMRKWKRWLLNIKISVNRKQQQSNFCEIKSH